jgi:hypothetical protein
MRAGSCKIVLGSETLATGSEGTKTLAAAKFGGTVLFSLVCTKQDGSQFTASDTITVQ